MLSSSLKTCSLRFVGGVLSWADPAPGNRSPQRGITKLRCLHARRDTEVKIELLFSDRMGDPLPSWRYVLGFKPEGKGAQRLMVSTEEVWQGETI